MAKQPNVIPFQEGAPADELEVEQIGDEVLIGNASLDDIVEITDEHDQNLAEELDENDSARKAQNLLEAFESDKEARSEWEYRYKQGLETLEPDGGLSEEEEQRATRGLSTVVHPMIAEAATQFNAKAIAELYPSGGPVKTTIIGEPTEELEDQARRVKDYMNYQITQEMPEYFPDLDTMLFQLPLIGHAFKKVFFDTNLGRQCSQFVKAEDFIVAPDSKDLLTSIRYSHIIRMPRNDYNRYVEGGYYLPIKYMGSEIDPAGNIGEEIEGVSQGDEAHNETVTLIEMHVYETFDGIDGIVDDEENQDMVAFPYVVTIDYDSQKIVSVRRNWEQEDEKKLRQNYFISYRFLPGTGFYGFGLFHLIGGLGKAATGSLRALLDSAAFSNMQGGFKLKGRVTGGDLQVNPGEFADLDATVDDVNKAIMPLPFKEPSGTLFNLMNAIVQAGQRFASTADLNVGDVNPNAPVGSTVALIEQGSKAFSAIHKRLHYSQGQEFKLIAKSNAKYLPEQFEFAISGVTTKIFSTDFDSTIDIVPVSDPNVFSTAQRIAQAQSVLQLSQSAPQLYDMYDTHKRMLEALRIPNIGEVLKEPEEAVRIDPVDENMSVMYGKPIRAFPEQDHDAHIAVHMQFIQDPSLGGNPGARNLQPVLIAHIAEHIALLYRQRMQTAIGMQLAPLPDIRDPKFKFEDLSPELDMQISQRASQVVAQSPQMAQIDAITNLGQQQQQGNPLQFAQQLAQLEAQMLQMKTKQDLEIESAKAKQDMQIKDAEFQQDLAMEQAKTQADINAKFAKLEADLAILREKNLAKQIDKGVL
tara:strand:- start:618 stop:3050 length:2433 start_codon:yes stop_codon:yes gene_type:complete